MLAVNENGTNFQLKTFKSTKSIVFNPSPNLRVKMCLFGIMQPNFCRMVSVLLRILNVHTLPFITMPN